MWRVKTIRTASLLSPPPLALPLVLAAIAHLVVAALLPVNLVVLVVADKSVSIKGIQNYSELASDKSFIDSHLRGRVLGDPFSSLIPRQVVLDPERLRGYVSLLH